jgi:hypothetical protein
LERAADELVLIAEASDGDAAAALVRWQTRHAISIETALDEAVRTMTPTRRAALQARWGAIAERLRARLAR